MRGHLVRACALILGLFLATFSFAQIYSVTNLGALPDTPSHSRGHALNSSGQATGDSAAPGTLYPHGFFWSSSTGMLDIGDLPGGIDSSGADDINDLGQIVGVAHVEPAVAGDTGLSAFIWSSAGGMRDLGLPADSQSSWAHALNNAGQVVGHSTSGNSNVHRAFIWTEATGFTDLGDLPNGVDRVSANDINEAGVVVGSSGGVNEGRAFRWNAAGGMQQLQNLSSIIKDSVASSINDLNYAVGDSDNGTGTLRAVLWAADGGVTDLGALGGGNSESGATDINNLGAIIGTSNLGDSEDEDWRPVIWSGGGGPRDLNTMLDASGAGWELRLVSDINDAGQIVGTGTYCAEPNMCFERAFLLTPVPEPGVLMALAVGVFTLTAARRTRNRR